MMSGDKKGSGLDIFDSLTKKKESAIPSESGVMARSGGSKAPPPPPSLVARPNGAPASAPLAPPSLASLSAPVARPSATPPPPPSAMRPTPSAPPPPSSLRQTGPIAPIAPPPAPLPMGLPTPPIPPAATPPPPSVRPPAPPSVSRAPAPPPGSLQSYSGDAEDDAPTRLYSSGGSTPPPPMVAAQRTLPRNDRPPPPQVPTFGGSTRGVSGLLKNKLVLAGIALGVLVTAVVLLFGGRTGALTVTVSGPGGRPVDDVSVFIDGTKVCDKSPCRVQDLAPGVHLVRAGAKGYQDTADQAVSIQAGEQGSQNVSLASAGAGTGVRVSAMGSGLKLYVDGQELGELPQTAKNLTAGEHKLRVAGNDRYEPWEERVILEDGEMKTLGPLKLRVLKGLATFKPGPGADDARVLLDGRLVPQLPATIEVPAGKQLILLATKTGYSTYRRTVSFEDGVAEKTFEITMVEGNDEPATSTDTAAAAAPASAGHATSPRGHAAAPAPAPAAPKVAAKGGKATLNLNSIPASNVILNGRPLGSTPKVGLQVAPGPQTVVFVHPQKGRKVMSGNVGAGETKAFTAKF